jgi:hypothetical protein
MNVPWYLSAKVLWPLFPLLLLIVVVCLTWALVRVVRHAGGSTGIWLQGAALVCYLLAAIAAVASERGGVLANVHRPFSVLTQLAIALALFHVWRKDRSLVVLNATAWAAILSDTALHYVLTRG